MSETTKPILLMDFSTTIPNQVYHRRSESQNLEVLSISYYQETNTTFSYVKRIIEKVRSKKPEEPSPLEREIMSLPPLVQNRIVAESSDMKAAFDNKNAGEEYLKIAKAFLTPATQATIPKHPSQEWFEQYVLHEQDGNKMGWETIITLEKDSPYIHLDTVTTQIEQGTWGSRRMIVVPKAYDHADVLEAVHNIYQSVAPDFEGFKQFRNISAKLTEQRAVDIVRKLKEKYN